MDTILINGIALLIIVCLVSAASFYIYKEKKKGRRCIGCPMAGNCSKTKVLKDCSTSEHKS